MTTCFSDLVELHEGRRRKLYRDTAGKLTGGVGHNFDDVPLSDAIIDFIKAEDIHIAAIAVHSIFGFAPDPANPRHAALLDMAFELGETRLRGFIGLRACWERQDWEGAADAMENSLWAREVPARAASDCALIRTGAWPTPPVNSQSL